jgi:hypothetical protein
VTGALVLLARVAQADDEQVRRRTAPLGSRAQGTTPLRPR